MKNNWLKMNKTELLALPVREWASNTIYDWLLIVPTRLKHDSGFACIAIIGCKGDEPVEICAYPDDLQMPVIPDNWSVRMDCSYPKGILRFWSNRYKFQVPRALSSTEIKLVRSEHES